MPEMSLWHVRSVSSTWLQNPLHIASGWVAPVCTVQIMQDQLACACIPVADVSIISGSNYDCLTLRQYCLSYLRWRGCAHRIYIVETRAGQALRWDCEQEESTLYSKLRAISATGTFTLSPVTAAALSGAFLPGLLPQAWAGQSKIRCVSHNQACVCVSRRMRLCICSH